MADGRRRVLRGRVRGGERVENRVKEDRGENGRLDRVLRGERERKVWEKE